MLKGSLSGFSRSKIVRERERERTKQEIVAATTRWTDKKAKKEVKGQRSGGSMREGEGESEGRKRERETD